MGKIVGLTFSAAKRNTSPDSAPKKSETVSDKNAPKSSESANERNANGGDD